MSTGPRTAEGKAISRQNSFKHGLTGRGVVVAEDDVAEIERRVEALEADMRPRSPVGESMIRLMATLSVRAERATEHESAAIARNVRHAADDFDEARLDEADDLFDALGDDPRRKLRRLRKTPEGVDRLLEAWRRLRDDLTRDRPTWDAARMVLMANLTGDREDKARQTRIGALSRGTWGDFAALGDREGGGLDDDARRAWSRARLVERVDAEIAALEVHRATLDFEMIELDRAEAGARALFDGSKDATRARRYQAEAVRGYFKALKEFRQAEAESLDRAGSAPTPSKAQTTPPIPPPPRPPLASSRDPLPPIGRDRSEAWLDAIKADLKALGDHDGQPIRPFQPPQTPG